VDVLKRLAADAPHAWGIICGPSHCELKWSADSPIVVEIAARFGAPTSPSWFGPPPASAITSKAVGIACGASDLPVPEQLSALAMRNVYADGNGRLTAIDGLAGLSAVPGHVAVHVSTVEHEVSTEIRDYRRRRSRAVHRAHRSRGVVRTDDAATPLRLAIDPGVMQA
jgi:hypothetical protein